MQKSKILALLLVVAMIASFVVVPASANAAPTTCAHCGAVTEWIALSGTITSGSYTLVDGKHYYLTGNVQLESDKFYANGIKACLDLNGYTITTAENNRLIQVYSQAEFSIMDSSANKTGKVQGVGEVNAVGGLIYLSSAGSKMYIYGGTFTGGSSTAADDIAKRQGGGIYMNQGTILYMNGGTFVGNTANRGGNIYMRNHAELYLSGNAKIEGGIAADLGGNIATITEDTAKIGTVKISDNAVVTGGKAANVGGNLYFGANQTAVIEGGVISDGQITGGDGKTYTGGNIYTETNLTLDNAVITGGTAGRAGSIDAKGLEDAPITLTIKGNTTIGAGTVAAADTSGSFCVRANNYVNVNLSEDAEIAGLTLAAGTKLNMTGGTVDKMNVRAGDKSEHKIFAGTINEMGGNDNAKVTIYGGQVNKFTNSGTAATISSCATVLNVGETGKIYYHAAGACQACNYTFSGDLDLKGMTVTVPTGKTLDASVAGNIIDSVGGGKLIGNVLFNDENAMLPITTADGIVFEEVAIEQNFAAAYTAGDATAKYAFYFDVAAAETKLDEAVAAGTATIDVYVKWNNGTADVEDVFVLDATTAAQYAQAATWDSSMIVLNLAGLSNVTLLECAVRVTSNGVTLQ